MQMTSFILLRRRLPNIDAALPEPGGGPGGGDRRRARRVSLVAIFLNSAYRPGVYGVAIYYVLGVLYFAIAGRNRLVLSPGGGVRLTQGEHGHPEDRGVRRPARRGVDRRRRRPREDRPAGPVT